MRFISSPMRSGRIGAILATALILTGCAGYHKQVGTTVDAVRAGSAEAALADLEAKNADNKEKDLLYYLEKGELQRMTGAYQPSLDTWNQADEKVRAWEEQAKLDASKLLGNVGSVLLNDTTRRYDGRDYEKVLLSVRLALNQLALGNWEGARIEIKKMHEREAVIADFRAKDLEDAKASAESKGLKATSFKEINGYPVEALEAPEVVALKNAYESAIANYLAGFIYEASGDPSLAAAGYRKAIELRPNQPFLEAALAGLDGRARGIWAPDPRIAAYDEAVKAATDPKTGKLKKGTKLPPVPKRTPAVDTLVVVESGLAPAITSRMIPIPLPIPSKSGLQIVMTPISWPVLEPVSVMDQVTSLNLGSEPLPLTLVTSVDHMARRALADEMPGIVVRTSVRAILKGAAQKVIQDNAGSMGLAGTFLSIAAGVAAVATEQADERTWRTLPAFYSATRLALTPGEHQLTIQTPSGPTTRTVQVSGRHAVIVLRTSGNALYLAQSPYTPPAPTAVAEPTPEILPAPGKKAATTKKAEGSAPSVPVAVTKPKSETKADTKADSKSAPAKTPAATTTPVKKETAT